MAVNVALNGIGSDGLVAPFSVINSNDVAGQNLVPNSIEVQQPQSAPTTQNATSVQGAAATGGGPVVLVGNYTVMNLPLFGLQRPLP